MFVPDLSSRLEPGHSRFVLMTTPRSCAWSRFVLLSLLGLASCSADGGDGAAGAPVSWRPWVEGGQTGALTPPCGLTPAAAAGDSIPGGSGGIVLHTNACVGFVAASLELHDEDGMMVSFDIERLPGDAVLLRPRSPLMAGVYRLTGPGLQMAPVVAVEPAELPTRLGELEAEGTSCGANFELTLDPLVLEYLPQLKLSVSVDGAAPQTWFDYGELKVEDDRAELSLSECFPGCLYDGSHSVRVTAELAGEDSTLEPIELTVQSECPVYDGNDAGACGAANTRGRSSGGGGLMWGLLVAVLVVVIGVRRVRRSSA
jgi:hypothetical protein